MRMVVEQLRCAGVIEAIRISRSAYPNRMTHMEFLDRFEMLKIGGADTSSADALPSIDDMKDACRTLMEQYNLKSPEEYQLGEHQK